MNQLHSVSRPLFCRTCSSICGYCYFAIHYDIWITEHSLPWDDQCIRTNKLVSGDLAHHHALSHGIDGPSNAGAYLIGELLSFISSARGTESGGFETYVQRGHTAGLGCYVHFVASKYSWGLASHADSTLFWSFLVLSGRGSHLSNDGCSPNIA